jgi:hypothetical protein
MQAIKHARRTFSAAAILGVASVAGMAGGASLEAQHNTVKVDIILPLTSADAEGAIIIKNEKEADYTTIVTKIPMRSMAWRRSRLTLTRDRVGRRSQYRCPRSRSPFCSRAALFAPSRECKFRSS